MESATQEVLLRVRGRLLRTQLPVRTGLPADGLAAHQHVQKRRHLRVRAAAPSIRILPVFLAFFFWPVCPISFLIVVETRENYHKTHQSQVKSSKTQYNPVQPSKTQYNPVKLTENFEKSTHQKS